MMIVCPSCGSEHIKKNGHIHNGKQNYMCLKDECSRQFVLNPENKIISDDYKERIRRMLLERISLRGICRVMDVSMPWLLNYAKGIYDCTPEDLFAVVDMESVEKYPEDKFNELIYDLLESGIEDKVSLEQTERESIEDASQAFFLKKP
jgi:hypothetical protein